MLQSCPPSSDEFGGGRCHDCAPENLAHNRNIYKNKLAAVIGNHRAVDVINAFVNAEIGII